MRLSWLRRREFALVGHPVPHNRIFFLMKCGTDLVPVQLVLGEKDLEAFLAFKVALAG